MLRGGFASVVACGGRSAPEERVLLFGRLKACLLADVNRACPLYVFYDLRVFQNLCRNGVNSEREQIHLAFAACLAVFQNIEVFVFVSLPVYYRRFLSCLGRVRVLVPVQLVAVDSQSWSPVSGKSVFAERLDLGEGLFRNWVGDDYNCV